MGAPRTTHKIFDVLNQHRGLDVPLAEITKTTGYTKAQVLTGIGNLIKRDGLPITVVVKGAAWRYEAANKIPAPRKPEAEDRLFELVGKTKNGDRIVRGDVTEVLYVLEEISFS